ncbi:MAG TPA: protein kinase [Clostridia bacterium]|nr:protein kinase [Clostridia bacterium]
MKEAAGTIDKYQPLWGSWKADELIAQEDGCELYRVYKEEWGKQYVSTVKLLSFLVGRNDILEAQTLGLDPAELPLYFKSLVDIQNEIELMYRLRGSSNIIAYEDHTVFEKKDGKGWDVLIRMEYLQPLSRVIPGNGLEASEAARLGSDICRALEVCAREGIIHRDIKDSSIFVSPRGEYKLGSFGMAKELNKGGRSALQSLSPLYMAPELYKEQGYDSSVDIYSLGIVMYKLLNRGRLPFLPPPPGIITAGIAEKALLRRMSGEELPLPVNAGDSLGAIVLKACSYEKKDRYKSPAEFRQKLERFLKAESRSTRGCVAAPAQRSDCTGKACPEKEEAALEAAYVRELEKVAVVELAASIDKMDNERRKKDMRFIRNACIAAAIAILAFTAAFFNAYKTEQAAEEGPVAEAASIPVKAAGPSPTVEATPVPEPAAVKSGEDHYNEGIKHMKYSRFRQAISAFEEAKKLGYDTRKSDSQIRTARKKLELQKLNSEAMKLYEQKDYENAITAFESLARADAAAGSLAQYSDSFFRLAEEHNLSGVEYHNQGKLEQSVKEFDAALGVLDRMKKEEVKYEQARYNRQYELYDRNRDSLLEKMGRIDEYIRLADEGNRAGVQYFSEGSLDRAKEEFEKALVCLGKIKQLVPKYQESRYESLVKICGDNLNSIEEKLAPEQ